MSDAIHPHPSVLKIEAYKGGKAHIDGQSGITKLSSNENPFGYSDRVKDVFGKALHALNRYPAGDHRALRETIGEVHEISPDRIICGAGSDEIIAFLCQAYSGPGDEVLFTEYGFLMYRIGALAAGATPVEVSEKDRHADVDTLLAACNKRTRLVFLANPNNPTGTMLPMDEIARLAEGLPPGALLVIDSAYAEYVEGYDGGLSLANMRENVFVTRTFSKIYGLGGLRVGWGYGPAAVIDVLNRVRGPFNLSQTQQDVAAAAVQDQDWVVKCRLENTRLREWLLQALVAIGVPCDPSYGNFLLARFESASEADGCDAHLQSQGLIVRHMAGYKLPDCLRITIGDESSCRRIAHAIGQFKEGAK